MWLFCPALFQISPSCYFTFHDVASKSSYMLLGCCRDGYWRCRWVLMGFSKGHWPSLYLTVEQKILVFLCAFFVTTICLLYLHITRPDIPGHHSSCNHSETLHCTFCLSMCWTSTGISGSAKYVIAEKCLDIGVIHWSQCRSGGYYSSESFGDKGHHTSIPKPGLLVLLTEQLAFKLWYAPECTSLLSLW